MMTKSNFQPPKLKDRVKWTGNFHQFEKIALTKTPKKRPAAGQLLQHLFISQPLSRTLAIELLDKVSNLDETSYQAHLDHLDDDETDTEELQMEDEDAAAGLGSGSGFILSGNSTPETHLDDKAAGEDEDETENDDGCEDRGDDQSGVSDAADHHDNGGGDSDTQQVKDLMLQPSRPLPPQDGAPPPVHDHHSNQDQVSETSSSDQQSAVPPAVFTWKDKTDSPKPNSNGLPPTPKVHMGACFSKVFNSCPLKIHSAASWINPDTRDQYLVFGAEEGIYTLNLNKLHENWMEQLVPRRCTWVYVMNNTLISISGRTSQLYCHSLVGLFEQARHKQKLTVSILTRRLPDRILPRRFSISSKIPDTKGCLRCCIVRNPYTGHKYLGGAFQSGMVLLEWVEPVQKFMLVKNMDFQPLCPLEVLELLVVPEQPYPLICVGLNRGTEPNQPISFQTLDPNSCYPVPPDTENPQSCVIHITQLERDTVLVCLDRCIKIVNLQGKLKSSKKLSAELTFNFQIEAIDHSRDQ